MAEVTYAIVEHDGGWAYRVGDVYSETFATEQAAKDAANAAAQRQRQAGEATDISFEDSDGRWHREFAAARDRPDTRVVDEN